MSKLRLLALAAAIAIGATIGGVASAQTFSDVPPSHPFFDEIEAVAKAGVTGGYSDGTYRPGAPVTRQAMAAFMGRGFGRLGADNGTFAGLTAPAGEYSDWVVSEPVTITSGAATSGSFGWVMLEASFYAFAEPLSECSDCFVEAGVFRNGELVWVSYDQIAGSTELVGTGSGGISIWYPIQANTTDAYTVRLRVYSDTGGAVSGGFTLNALYVPFDGSGNAPGFSPDVSDTSPLPPMPELGR